MEKTLPQYIFGFAIFLTLQYGMPLQKMFTNNNNVFL